MHHNKWGYKEDNIFTFKKLKTRYFFSMGEKYLLFLYYSSLSWFISRISILDIVKTRQQAQNGVTHAKPHVTKLRPNYSSSSPRNGTLNQSVRDHLISTSGVVCLTGPCLPRRKVTLH